VLYSINEIFYSIQGEGRNVGMPAWFIRMAGCNLKCSFCDTDFSEKMKRSEESILQHISSSLCKNVIITGGEPSLQNLKPLLKLLKYHGYYVAIETNGTKSLLRYRVEGLLDWVTVSPKQLPIEVNCMIDEIKVIWPSVILEKPAIFTYLEQTLAKYYYIQPCDNKNIRLNINEAVKIVKTHPKWRLSLQMQKVLKIR